MTFRDVAADEGVSVDAVCALVENMDPRLTVLLDQDKFRYLLRSLRRAGLIHRSGAEIFAQRVRSVW